MPEAAVEWAKERDPRCPTSKQSLVFNHSSYIDSLVLTAVLPGEPAIVAKRELFGQFIAGPLLRRLEIPFVERYDVSGSLADTNALIALAHRGRILVFFPEGHSPEGRACPCSISVRSRWRLMRRFPFCRASSAARDRCCVASNGSPVTLRSASRSGSRLCRRVRISGQCCGCAMRCATSCCLVAENPILGS